MEKGFLILDTEQTYGDVGVIILQKDKIVYQHQFLIDVLWNNTKETIEKKMHQQSYDKIKDIVSIVDFKTLFTNIDDLIKQYNCKYLCTHNLSADSKVFKSWCAASGNIMFGNPFLNIDNHIDSQEIVKYLSIQGKNYSLEDFIKEIGITDFKQEHTGLADANLVANIVLACGTDNVVSYFRGIYLDTLKKYMNNDRSLDSLLKGNGSTSNFAYQLYQEGLCFKQTCGKTGQVLQKPQYYFNSIGKRHIQDMINFINNKGAILNNIQRNFTEVEINNMVSNLNESQLKDFNELKLKYEEMQKKIISDAIAEGALIKTKAKKEAQEIINKAKNTALAIKSNAQAIEMNKEKNIKTNEIQNSNENELAFDGIAGVVIVIGILFILIVIGVIIACM